MLYHSYIILTAAALVVIVVVVPKYFNYKCAILSLCEKSVLLFDEIN